MPIGVPSIGGWAIAARAHSAPAAFQNEKGG